MSEPSYQPTGGSGPSGPRSGFWRRFAAAFIDGIILSIVYFIISALISDNAATGLNLVISAGYYTYLEGGASGQTLGKKALGIRVIDLSGGGPIGYGRGLHPLDRPDRLCNPAGARLLLDAVGQGEADLARQVRRLGRRAGVRVPRLLGG